jgi:hypothetical protein
MAVYNLDIKLAFPSAKGFGKSTSGGRGKNIYVVTNTNDSGPGSLREKLESSQLSGGGIIVFATSGYINLQTPLNVYGNTTIAGETSPGGICIRLSDVWIRESNVIVRYIKFRPGPNSPAGTDGLKIRTSFSVNNFIIDHCSLSHAKDENFNTSVTGDVVNDFVTNWTLQYCMLYHSYGSGNALIGNQKNGSVYKNYFSNEAFRSPITADCECSHETINNIIHGVNEGQNTGFGSNWDAIGQIFQNTGPNSALTIQDPNVARPNGNCMHLDGQLGPNDANVYEEDTIIRGGGPFKSSNYQIAERNVRQVTGSGIVPMIIGQDNGAALEADLFAAGPRGVGASIWRDTFDQEQINDYFENTITVISDNPAYPVINDITPPVSTIIPGIPNDFVNTHGITSASQIKTNWTIDNNIIINNAGYTAIEIYLFSLTGDLTLPENINNSIILNTLKAFPTADGFGKYTTGGRGGQVIKVTNLNTSGPGSLDDALRLAFPRIIVFAVSGTIRYTGSDYPIIPSNAGNVTIAGETSPGGIVIRGGRLRSYASNVIIRHIRFHQDPSTSTEANDDSFTLGEPTSNVPNIWLGPAILDHCSFSYGLDGNLDIRSMLNVTIQYCMFYYSDKSNLINSNSKNISYIKNLHALCYQRAVRANTIYHLDLTLEQINNIIYDVSYPGGPSEGLRWTGENNIMFKNPSNTAGFNYLYGVTPPDPNNNEPNTVENTRYYVSGNINSAYTYIVKPGYEQYKISQPLYRSEYIPLSTIGLEDYILDNVGAGTNTTTQSRSSLDEEIITHVRNRTGNNRTTSGFFPIMGSGIYPNDSNITGIPNTFVTEHNILSSNQVITNWTINNTEIINNAGYTAIEIYLFTLTKDLVLLEDFPNNTVPIITLLGNTTITLNVGQSYIEPGFIAEDNEEGNITNNVIVTGSINTNVEGTYTLNYNVTDSNGAAAIQKTRVINVITPKKGIWLKGGQFNEVNTPIAYLGSNKLKG